ncbi:MAG: DUF4105 domain-containing protein [Deltaproteobacteria bacterium]|jgi:hypothetical protein|nr:DUF4105 domain-containing protein [Deltaproteobacteria bacterium]
MIIFFTIFFNFFNFSPQAAELEINPSAKQAWVIIIEPGSHLFTKFGHSAFVILSSEKEPMVYDFGNFIYDDKFLHEFFKGKAHYFVDKKAFSEFISTYKKEKRTIRLYQLNFHSEKVVALEQKLNKILDSSEKFYLYHHFKKNCATQMRNLISTLTKGEFRAFLASRKGPTWRRSLDKALGKYTSMSLGLKLILAGQMDKKRTMWDGTFMPLHLEKALKISSIKQGYFGQLRPLVKTSILFYQGKDHGNSETDLFPVFFAGIVLFFFLLPFFWFKNLFLTKFDVLLLFFLQSFFALALLFFGYHLEICAWNINFLSFFPLFLIPPLLASRQSFYQLKTLVFLCLSLSLPLLAVLIKPWIVQNTFPFSEFMVVLHLLIIGQWLLKYHFLIKNSEKAVLSKSPTQSQSREFSDKAAKKLATVENIEKGETGNEIKKTNLETKNQIEPKEREEQAGRKELPVFDQSSSDHENS